MRNIYLLLGTNVGDRVGNLINARFLMEQNGLSILIQSALYETEAWGVKDQQSFLNQCIEIDTSLPPIELLHLLQSIEKKVGRVDTIKWGPRVMDIDILFYGQQLVDLPDLKIPHSYISERRFTLVPLAEIASLFIHPVLEKTAIELLRLCPDNSIVEKMV